MKTTENPVIAQTAALIERNLSFDTPDTVAIAQYQQTRLRLIKELLQLLHLDANTIQAAMEA